MGADVGLPKIIGIILGMKVGIDDMIGTALGAAVGMAEALLLEGLPAGAEDGDMIGRITIKEGGLTDVIPLTSLLRSGAMSLLANSACKDATEWFVEFVVTM